MNADGQIRLVVGKCWSFPNSSLPRLPQVRSYDVLDQMKQVSSECLFVVSVGRQVKAWHRTDVGRYWSD